MTAAPLPRVMFVDDDVNLLRSLERALRSRRLRWEMAFVESAEAALAACAEHHVAAVVTDMSMPGMDGLDLVRSLNRRSPATHCIVLTGVADLQMATTIINTARVFRFYTKPCPVDRLVAGIDEALDAPPPESEVGEDARASAVGLLALDRLATAVIVVDGNARVLHMNQAGGALVAERDGFAVDASEICRGAVAQETQALHGAIRAQAAAGPDEDAVTAVSLTRPSMRHPLLVIVSPLESEQANGGAGSVALFVTDPDRPPTLDADVVGRLYGLTAAESRLACALAAGRDLADAAAELNITMESARTYLKRIFMKTDTRRQAELVRLILASPALVPHANGHVPA